MKINVVAGIQNDFTIFLMHSFIDDTCCEIESFVTACGDDFTWCLCYTRGPGSVVGIANGYGLDGHGIESQ
jgi:hypothetical protein